MIHVTLWEQNAYNDTNTIDICVETIGLVKKKIIEHIKETDGCGFYRLNVRKTHGNFCKNCGEEINKSTPTPFELNELLKFWENKR